MRKIDFNKPIYLKNPATDEIKSRYVWQSEYFEDKDHGYRGTFSDYVEDFIEMQEDENGVLVEI